MSVPCTGCICKPICKQKSFAQLYRECSTISEFTNLNGTADPVSVARLSEVDKALNRYPERTYFTGSRGKILGYQEFDLEDL